jgi:hypothetical protein
MASGLFNLKQVNQAISQGAWSGYIAPRWVEYLVVAGGGAGGADDGGGGGAGGLLTGIVTVAAGASYSVTVGAGGTAGSFPSAGGDGVASVFGSISSTGGGGGGFRSDTLFSGRTGGSGGGSSNIASGERVNSGGIGVTGQGNYGGSNTLSSAYGSGGGGGAGTVGINATSTTGGSGGAGIASAITGTVVAYSGGGGGSTRSGTAGSGGVGGGGTSGVGTSNNGTAGAANTGGGGGGGAYNSSLGGAGGSGIVVVRYPGNVQFYTGGTVTYSNGYIVHNFTANGTLAPTTPTVVSEYQISRSLRFNGADSTKLTRTPSSSTSGTLGTFSFWTKLGPLVSGSNNGTFISAADSYAYGQFYQNTLYFGNTTNYLNTTAVFRDFSAWYHIVFAFDTTQATSTNRLKIYVNGVLQTAGSLASYPAQNASFPFLNGTQQYQIGGNGFSSSVEYYNGYMTEVNFIDGQALTPTSFGYVNPTTGIWSPAKFVGGYGTNGFYVNFSDNSNTTAATLGADYSGNGNNWTPNNFSVTAGAGNDSLVDSPTSYGTDTGVGGSVRGNYSTWSPLANLGLTLTNGNLSNSYTTLSWTGTTGTMAMDSGTWYFEYTVSVTATYTQIGVIGTGRPLPTGGLQLQNGTAYAWSYQTYGQLGNNSTYITSGISSATTNDIIMVAVDVSNGKIWFGKNGTWFNSGSPSTGANAAYTNLSGSMIPAIYSYGVESGDTNFGQRPFAYTAPSGFKALCTQNLPTPTIGATSATLATQYFGVSTYTGNGSTQSITVKFQPDWVWYKSRSSGVWNHGLFDSVRGVTKQLFSNTTGAEATYSGVTAFNSGGFSVGSDNGGNESGGSMVAWNWRASNATAVSNTAGSLTSSVSANTTSGFSIVTYTGNSTSGATVGHGLGVTPSMVIVKGRDTAGLAWCVYVSSLGATQYLFLNDTAAAGSYAGFWNNTAPTSTLLSLGNDNGTNGTAKTYVAYCFAEIAGYSKFGSYTGNGSANGPFIYTGFKPAFVMVKNIGSGENWLMFDGTRNTYNVTNNKLAANSTVAENDASLGDATQNNYDFLSNGFKAVTTNSGTNASAGVIVYMAFASNPFKYSLAR